MPARLRLGGLAIEGESRGGESSWFRLHPPGLAFDVGRGAPELVGARDLFVSHGHLDHALGLPFVLSRRAAQGLGETRVFCPRPARDRFAEFIEAAARLESREYAFALHGLEAGDRVEVAPRLAVRAFAVDHVVPSLGFQLLRRRHRLLPALAGTPASAIAERARRGDAVQEEFEEAWLSYCADTTAAVFDREPTLRHSRVLMIEATFLGGEHRERAGRYGHLHFEDLEERADVLDCEAIVLVHLSRRHTAAELRRRVAASRSRVLRERGIVFAPEADGARGGS